MSCTPSNKKVDIPLIPSAAPPKHLSFHTFSTSPLPELTVTGSPQRDFEYFGLDKAFDTSLPIIHLQAFVEGDVWNLFQAFLKTVREQHLADEHNAYWLTIRIQDEPTREYDIPRWHQDGGYWDMGPDEMPYKVGTTFTGPSTLFIEPAKQHLLTYNASYERQAETNHDPEQLQIEKLWLAEQFKNVPVVQAKPGELARWTVGGGDAAVLHSEPPMHGQRVFISVLPGTEAQIRQLCKRWKRDFVDGKEAAN